MAEESWQAVARRAGLALGTFGACLLVVCGAVYLEFDWNEASPRTTMVVNVPIESGALQAPLVSSKLFMTDPMTNADKRLLDIPVPAKKEHALSLATARYSLPGANKFRKQLSKRFREHQVDARRERQARRERRREVRAAVAYVEPEPSDVSDDTQLKSDALTTQLVLGRKDPGMLYQPDGVAQPEPQPGAEEDISSEKSDGVHTAQLARAAVDTVQAEPEAGSLLRSPRDAHMLYEPEGPAQPEPGRTGELPVAHGGAHMVQLAKSKSAHSTAIAEPEVSAADVMPA